MDTDQGISDISNFNVPGLYSACRLYMALYSGISYYMLVTRYFRICNIKNNNYHSIYNFHQKKYHIQDTQEISQGTS